MMDRSSTTYSQRPVSPLSLKISLLFLCILGLRGVLCSPALAQVSDSELSSLERAAAVQRQSTSTLAANVPAMGIDFLSLLLKGGWFMVPIGFVSLLVLTIFFDRLIALRSGRIIPRRFRKSLVQIVRQNEYLDPKAVYRICVDSPSSVARVVGAMVLKTGRPMSEMQTAISDTTQREVDRAYANVRWLNLAAGIAPLLGLLGTVWGLIRAFHDTTQLTAGQNRADYLAVGIYEALVTTLAGLMVAIPAAVASHFFEGRITKLFGQIEELVSDLVPRLERFEGKTRFDPIGRELVARDLLGVIAPHTNSPPEPHKIRPSQPRQPKA